MTLIYRGRSENFIARPLMTIQLEGLCWGWRYSSLVSKNTCCSSREPEFHSQHPLRHLVTLAPGDLKPLASLGIGTHIIYAHTDRHRHIDINKKPLSLHILIEECYQMFFFAEPQGADGRHTQRVKH